jgi:SAM-dependent methyltransferase
MAISKAAAALLFELKTTQVLAGTVCQLGKQTILVSADKINQVAEKFGFQAESSAEELPWTGNADDSFLFKLLGFDKVDSIDAEDFENATYVFDLNSELPESLHNCFDAIYDGGTMEHIFNLPQVLKNIHKMLKPGGLIMHLSPSNNHIDHGFYMFSPTFHYDYYSSNNYKVIRSNIVEYSPNPFNTKWKIYNYESLCLEHLAFGGWDSSMLLVWFVAQKTEASTDNIFPQQARYVSVWGKHKLAEPSIYLGKNSKLGRNLIKLKYILKRTKIVYAFLYRLRNLYLGIRYLLKSRKKPKIIARY